MAVGIAAGLVFLVYFVSIPVEIALKIRTQPKLDFGAGFAIFEGRFALRQAEKRMKGEEKHLPWGKLIAAKDRTAYMRAAKYLLRHLKVEKISLSGSIGLSDAAATAIVCGCAEAVKAAVMPFAWSKALRMDISPDFSGEKSRLQFSGMVSAAAGHIICTALLCAVYLAKGRIKQWKSTRLKIS